MYCCNGVAVAVYNFSVDGEVANLLRRCNVIWETTRHNRHNGLLSTPTCYGLATRKLLNCCNESWP